MKWYVIIICSVVVFWGCRVEGFDEGVFLQVQNATGDRLVVVFDNGAGVSDSVLCTPDSITQVPIDMHSSEMRFSLKGPSKVSYFSIAYTTAVRAETRQKRVLLDNVTGVLDTAANDHVLLVAQTNNRLTANRLGGWQLDSDENWNFINFQDQVLWIE